MEPQSTARPVVVRAGNVTPAARAHSLTMSGQSCETVNTVAVNSPSIGGARRHRQDQAAGAGGDRDEHGHGHAPTWPMSVMSPAASRMVAMTGAVSSAAAARWKDSPWAESQSHMLSTTSPGHVTGDGLAQDIEDGGDDVVHEGLAGDARAALRGAQGAGASPAADRNAVPAAASGDAAGPAAAACVSATMSALKSSSASIGKDSRVGSLTSWPAMRARPSRAFGVSTAASQAASIDDVSGMSSGMARTPSSAAPESPPPAQASSAIERAWKSMTFTGDAAPLTAATASPVTGSTTSMPAEASRSTVAATDSSPNAGVRMAATASSEGWSVGRTPGRPGQPSPAAVAALARRVSATQASARVTSESGRAPPPKARAWMETAVSPSTAMSDPKPRSMASSPTPLTGSPMSSKGTIVSYC